MNICATQWVLLLCSSVLLSVSANADTEGPYTFTISGGEATITDFSSDYEGLLTITNILGGYPVTRINGYAFNYSDKLIDVTIPSGINSIGDFAFDGCASLTNVTIPDSITSIALGAFSGCSSMVTISVDTNNSSYCSEDGVLFNKSKSVLFQYPGGKAGTYYIPTSVTNIDTYAFASCTGLTNVMIHDSVYSIGFYAFGSCSGLVNILVDTNNITFSSKDGVLFNKEVTILLQYPGGKHGSYDIPSSVTDIGTYAFVSCSGLTAVTIPDSVTSIDYGAFASCSALASVLIGQGVTNIGSRAFRSCSSLVSVTIPISVTSIGDELFYDCAGLTHLSIPNSITNIGHQMFSYCISLTNVMIPDSVTSIGYEAFNNCSRLMNVTIPNSVNSIGPFSFQKCTNLTSVVIGSGVTNIDAYAFRLCDALHKVYITGDAPSLGTGVFLESDMATIFYLPGTDGWTDVFGDEFPVLWNPVLSDVSIAVDTVSCTVTGTPSIPVALEVNTNLLSDVWLRLYETNITDGAVTLHDTNEMNGLVYFYRIAGP